LLAFKQEIKLRIAFYILDEDTQGRRQKNFQGEGADGKGVGPLRRPTGADRGDLRHEDTYHFFWTIT